nr:hypothetical protein [Flavihumibacter fluvii]
MNLWWQAERRGRGKSGVSACHRRGSRVRVVSGTKNRSPLGSAGFLR